MNVYYQATQPIIELSHDVYTNKSDENNKDKFKLGVYFTFSTSQNTGLQSYNFSRSTKELVGNFVLTIKELPNSEVNFLDSVRPLDVVKIYESNNDKPDFIGIVNNISFGAVAGALSKIITVSGKSIECLFDMYKLALDVTAMSYLSAKPYNAQFTDMLYARKTFKKTEKVTREVTLSNPKSKDEALNNLVQAFKWENIDLIKQAYSSTLISAKDSVSKLTGEGFSKNYVVAILAIVHGNNSWIQEASGYKAKKIEELKKEYKEKAESLHKKHTVTETKDVDGYDRIAIKIVDAIKKCFGIIQYVMKGHSEIGTLAIYSLLEKYYGVKGKEGTFTASDNSQEKTFLIDEINIDCDLEYNYPITSNPFSESTIKLFDYVRNLLPNTVYEMFGTIKDGIPYIKIREFPFGTLKGEKEDYSDFLSLYKDDYKITGDIITDYTFSLSNEQVYTSFLAYLEGSSLSTNQYMQISADKRGYKTAIIDTDKSGIYGYSLLTANFVGFQDNIETEDNFNETTTSKFKELDKKLKIWYGKLDEMFTGDVTVVNVKDKKYATIGEVIKLCGAYFYVVSENHHWRYGDTPKINYKLDRGGIYTDNSFKRIEGLSKQYAELDL